MNSSIKVSRSAHWFPKGCKYFALRNLTGVEVLSPKHRTAVQVAGTTLHGTAQELRYLASQFNRAEELAEAAG